MMQSLNSAVDTILSTALRSIAADLGIEQSKLWVQCMVESRPAIYYESSDGTILCACAVDSEYFRKSLVAGVVMNQMKIMDAQKEILDQRYLN